MTYSNSLKHKFWEISDRDVRDKEDWGKKNYSSDIDRVKYMYLQSGKTNYFKPCLLLASLEFECTSVVGSINPITYRFNKSYNIFSMLK